MLPNWPTPPWRIPPGYRNPKRKRRHALWKIPRLRFELRRDAKMTPSN